MKVALPKDYRQQFTLEELDTARRIIRDMKDDDATPVWYAEVAIDHWLSRKTNDARSEVLKASAVAAKNGRVWDAYGDGTERADVWIEAVAKTWLGYLEIGAYLTDIWSIGGDVDYTQHMYAQYYTREDME